MSTSETGKDGADWARKAVLTIKTLKDRLQALEAARAEPIAILGLSCRFPGAPTPEAFWQLLRDGVDAVREIPKDRWDIDAYYDPDPDAPGKMYTRYGGFLGDVAGFEPQLFGISPREAEAIDPQHRLLLEVTWEALERAGLSPRGLAGSSTGVFVGISGSEYLRLLLARGEAQIDAYYGVGNALNAAAGRIAFALGLEGPALAIDTACSSSLVAVHQACLALHAGDCGMALAGGVNLMLDPATMIGACRARMLAPDGRAKTFDAAADGFVRGEGAGVVVLKRLSDARRDGDPILAILRGSAVNQDGASSGLTVPNGAAQEALIRKALAAAGLKPEEVDYVEAHGTGTSLGDPIEVEALAAALARDRTRERPLRIGSVKTNIGHLESAAGIAGLIKVVLALAHRELPAQLHFQKANPHVAWDALAIEVVTQPRPWPTGEDRRVAGVSSFGFTGTNAHLLVEEAPPSAPLPKTEAPARAHHLLTLSARTDGSLRALARELAAWIEAHPEADLADIAFSRNTGRAHLERRAALVAASSGEALAALHAIGAGEPAPGALFGEAHRRPKIAFLFTGQGSQYPGMGRELYLAQPAFRGVLDRCDELSRGRLALPLLEVLFGAEAPDAWIHRTAYTQPALFALEVALATLWQSLGVVPDVVLGHSVGEYAAAVVAGVLSLEDGFSLLCERARLMESLPAGGVMISVLADRARVEPLIADLSGVEIAADNGASTALSGPAEAIVAARVRLEGRGLRVRSLDASRAFHSAAVEPILDAFEAFARTLSYRPAERTLLGNLTGGPERALDAAYLRRHARETVQFGKSLKALADLGVGLLLELGPSPVLVTLAQQGWPEGSLAPPIAASLRTGRSDTQQLAEAIAALYVHGASPDLATLDRPAARRKLPLPTYPFERQRFWFDASTGPAPRPAAADARATDPLLGRFQRSATSGEGVHAAYFDVEALPFLADHRVYGPVMVPGATYAAMALRATGVPCCLRDVVFHEPMLLEEARGRHVQLAFSPAEGARGGQRFQLWSAASDDAAASFTLHAEGHAGPTDAPLPAGEPPEAVAARLEARAPEALFAEYAALGVELGPTFRSIQRLWAGPGEALGELVVPEALGPEESAPLHPAVLDACTQIARAAAGSLDAGAWSGGFFAPFEYQRLELHAPVPRRFFCHVHRREVEGQGPGQPETLRFDLALLREDGARLGELGGFVVKRAPREAMLRGLRRAGAGLTYEVQWYEQAGRGPGVTAALADPSRVAAEVERRAAALSVEVGLDRLTGLAQPLEALAFAYVLAALRELGWEPRAGERVTAEHTAVKLGVARQHLRLFGRCLEMLVEEGLAEREPGGGLLIRAAPPRAEPAPAPLLQRFPDARIEITLLARCGGKLAAVLRGELDPLGLLFPEDGALGAEHLYRDAPGPEVLNRMVGEAVRTALADLPPRRMLRALEIGAGTGGTTAHVLPALPADRTTYTYTDISPAFFAKAEERFARFPHLTCRALDIERDPLAQGFAAHAFDLVIAANVLHATADLPRALEHARALLAPGGLLVLVEGTRRRRFLDLLFGLLPGWWRFNDAARPDYPLLGGEAWSELLGSLGFTRPVVLAPPEGALDQAVILARAPERPPRAVEPPKVAPAGTWLVFPDEGGLAAELAARLEARGERVVALARGEPGVETAAEPRALAQALERAVPPGVELRGVVLLGALDAAAPEPPLDLLAEVRRGAAAALQLSRALITLDRRPTEGLFIVTRGAQAAGDPRPLALAQSPLWGLGQVIALEHPELGCRLVDLDPERPAGEIEALVAEILSPDHEDRIALRAGLRRVPRLERVEPRALAQTALAPDASYLIAGGLGGLGLEVARWMVRRGARHLVLLGRRPPGPEEERVIAELRALGAEVRVAQGDVSLGADVERVLGEIAGSMPPLRGLIHAAGVLSDAVLANQSWDRFEAVLAPKVLGAFHLHRLTAGLALDFFVLFSSWVGLIGASGQANHAAANAFLDALAHHRRALGKPAISIDWGGWSEVGAVARRAVAARLSANGVGTLAPSAGIAILEQILADGPIQVGVMPIDWEIFARQFRDRRPPPLLARLLSAPPRQQGEGAARGELERRLAEARPEERARVFAAHVREEICRVLRLDPSSPPAPDRALFEVGMDSLMALELRNRLQAQLGERVKLPSTLVFEFPTLGALIAHLAGELGLSPAKAAPAPELPAAHGEAAREGAQEAPADLKQLSFAELASLLDARLAELDPKDNDA